MKKLLFILTGLLLFLESGVAAAQETYGFTLTAGQVVNIDLGRVQENSRVCEQKGLVSTCTQAQACVAYGVAGGASCTAADALAANCRIWSNNLAGREGFIKEILVKDKLDKFIDEQRRIDRKAFYTWCGTANQTAKDAACVAVGQAAGCYICNGY